MTSQPATSILIEKALPVMRRLRNRLKESVALVGLDIASGNGVTLAKEESDAGIAVRYEVNFQFPAHTAAPTKAILSTLPEAERRMVLDRLELCAVTEKTITDRDVLLTELAKARDNGYAVDRGEYLPAMHCVAAPILNSEHYPVAAIVTSSFSSRIPEKKFEETARLVKASATEIGLLLMGEGESGNAYAELVVEQAVEYFQEHTDVNLDVQKYAEDRHLKYSWFRTKFREMMKTSPKQYHLGQKIDKAKRLLAESEMSVKEIASGLGYDSQNNFSNLFRKKTGLFPTQYRATSGSDA